MSAVKPGEDRGKRARRGGGRPRRAGQAGTGRGPKKGGARAASGSEQMLRQAHRGGPGGGGPGRGAVMPHAKALHFRASGRRLLGYLRPQRVRLTLAIGIAIISTGLGVLGPKWLGKATNEIFTGFISGRLPKGVTQEAVVAGLRAKGESRQADMIAAMHLVPGSGVDFGAVGRILLAVLALYVTSALLGLVQGIIVTRVINRTVYGMRRDVEAKLATLPLSYYDHQPRGEILSRVTNDIDNVAQSLQQTATQMLNAVCQLVAVFVMMLTISPTLTLVALATVPVAAILTAAVARRSQPQFIKQWDATGQLNAMIEEAYTGHELVSVFNQTRRVDAEFHDQNADLYDASFRAQFVSGLIQPIMGFVTNLGYVVIAVVGGLRVSTGSMSLGDVQAFIQYSRQFTMPMTQVASMMNLLQSGVASAERVFDLLDAPEETPDPATPAALPTPLTGAVTFDHVDFSYEPDQPLIEDLTLHVKPGRTIAIVGPTGAGKTTLVNLLERFYDIQGGAIYLDGVDTTDLGRGVLRSHMGMVLQDTWLFNGTIEENIRYGRLDATDAELMEAAKATYVDRFVRSLPDGYATVVDEEGSGVSAGEKQLLTIARAFLKDPAILILDEATSSVDTRTELLVQKAMAKLRSGRTSFVIAHRLSTIRDADLILVMEHGAIVEQGNHAQLLAKRGAYYTLYQSQFSGAASQVA